MRLVTVTETVIKNIIDPETGQILLKNAVIERTINETVVGYDGILNNAAFTVLDSAMMELKIGKSSITVIAYTVYSSGSIYFMWTVQQLPWHGRVSLIPDTTSYRMSNSSTNGQMLQTFLNSPWNNNSGWAYMMRKDTYDIKLVLLAKIKEAQNYSIFHPCVANTNPSGETCIGSSDLKTNISKLASPTEKPELIQELFFSQFNLDWFQPFCTKVHLFIPTKDGINHSMTQSTARIPQIDLAAFSDMRIPINKIKFPEHNPYLTTEQPKATVSDMLDISATTEIDLP